MAANINAFHHALNKEVELQDTKKQLKEQSDKIDELEKRLAIMEKRLEETQSES